MHISVSCWFCHSQTSSYTSRKRKNERIARSISGLLKGKIRTMKMQAVIMQLVFLAHGGEKSGLNLRVICIAYRTAQIHIQAAKLLFKSHGLGTA